MGEEVVDSVRDDLMSAMAEHEDSAVAEPAAPVPEAPAQEPAPPEEISKDTKPRDTAGKFQKKEPEVVVDKFIDGKQVTNPPKSWKAEEKAIWEKMPPEARAIVDRREAEAEKGFTQLDEDRNFGKSMKETIAPYMSIITAEGGTPAIAVQSLLNTAYYLRSNATPQEKGKMIIGLAKQFNADISTPNSPVQPTDVLAQTQQEIAQLRQQIQQQPEVLRQQQETMVLQSHIDAFAADPKNVHFERLKPVMASLLQNGRAKDMQDAYDQASWADPEIRSARLVEDESAKEAKRIAEIKAKADLSRRASVSVRGSPGVNSAANGASIGSVRDDLMAAFDDHAA